MRTISSTLAPTATFTPSSSITSTSSHMLWHSPIPYLFGGLAAMFGLIVFALLLLACSYKRLPGQLQSQDDGGHRDLEKEGETQKKEQATDYEEKFLVVMAGDEKPTFLATLVCPKSFSFDVGVGNYDLDKQLGDREVWDKCEKEMDNNVYVVVVGGTSSTQENEGCQETQQQSL